MLINCLGFLSLARLVYPPRLRSDHRWVNGMIYGWDEIVSSSPNPSLLASQLLPIISTNLLRVLGFNI